MDPGRRFPGTTQRFAGDPEELSGAAPGLRDHGGIGAGGLALRCAAQRWPSGVRDAGG